MALTYDDIADVRMLKQLRMERDAILMADRLETEIDARLKAGDFYDYGSYITILGEKPKHGIDAAVQKILIKRYKAAGWRHVKIYGDRFTHIDLAR